MTGNELKEYGNEGNAYGRHRGEISGKEFGKLRSEVARQQYSAKKNKLDESVTRGNEKVKTAREKIEAAEKDIERQKKERKISDVVYQEKVAQIEKAKQKARELEKQLEETFSLPVTE